VKEVDEDYDEGAGVDRADVGVGAVTLSIHCSRTPLDTCVSLTRTATANRGRSCWSGMSVRFMTSACAVYVLCQTKLTKSLLA
jgi:hypothetical protein